MTHESYRDAIKGHNRRLAFVGRRALKLFTTLYLHQQLQASQSAATSSYLKKLLDSPSAVDTMLLTHSTGDKIGRPLQLEKVMRWESGVDPDLLGPRESGLLKIRGTCVEALVGAVYHERGAQIAHQFFTASILPHLVLEVFPGPVPDFLTQQFAKPT